MISRDLLELLVCPVTRAKLVYASGDRLVSVDPESRLAYPIEDDIPSLLPESGVALDEEEHRAALRWAEENGFHKP